MIGLLNKYLTIIHGHYLGKRNFDLFSIQLKRQTNSESFKVKMY